MTSRVLLRLGFALLVIAGMAFAGPSVAAAAGPCAIFKTWTPTENVINTDVNSSFTRVGVTNMITTCVDDYSTDVTQMQETADPYPSSVASLPTTLAGEITRLRYVIKTFCNYSQWYTHTEGCQPLGTFGSVGQTSTNNSTTPNTQFDLIATSVTLRNSSNFTVTRWNPATITVNISTAGPAANGRDVVGAFSASTWLHFYWIWNGTTLAGTASTTAPPTGPALPTGYTHWGYAGNVYFSASSALIKTRFRGDWAHYEGDNIGGWRALSGGTATTETAVTITAYVPPNALSFLVSAPLSGGGGTGVNCGVAVRLRVITGVNYFTSATRAELSGAPNVVGVDIFSPPTVVPNVGQTLYYILVNTGGSCTGTTAIDIHGYKMPNGGA